MTAVNTEIDIDDIFPNGGMNNSGYKVGYISAGAKATQNDTWTFEGVKEVSFLLISDDSTGIWEEPTILDNVVTLTNASTGAASGIIVYKTI